MGAGGRGQAQWEEAQLNAPPLSWHSAGIRAMVLNADASLLAVGGREAQNLVVYSMPDFTPMHLLAGHKNWVFAADFVARDTLVTGSRDGTIKVWSLGGCRFPELPTSPDASIKHPGANTNASGVRDVKHCVNNGHLSTLSLGGDVSQWDPSTMQQLRSTRLKHSQEPICLALQDNLIAAGTLESIALLDSRMPDGCMGTLGMLEPAVGGNGVRSLSIEGWRVTAGHSQGQVLFYDLRTRAVLHPTVYGASSKQGLPHLMTGWGWNPRPQNPDHVNLFPRTHTPWAQHNGQAHSPSHGPFQGATPPAYYDHLGEGPTLSEPHACLAHAWDATGTRLLTAGGPIRPYLKGCCMSVWS